MNKNNLSLCLEYNLKKYLIDFNGMRSYLGLYSA